MTKIIETLDVIAGDYFGIGLPDIKATDIVEILIIAVFIYYFLAWIKNSRAWVLFRGIMVILIFFGVAAVFQMNTILWIGEKLVGVVFVALLIVFQPELRQALEFLGRNNIWKTITAWGSYRGATKKFSDASLNAMVTACYEMGAVKTGALIVIENNVSLAEYERTGIPLDSLISRQLIINIFEKNTPLHDGAVIVRGDRITSATCYLPLSDNMNISKELGTRHRAALGISEVCDALTIVVSEETGKVSATLEGRILRDLQPDDLVELLQDIQMPKEIEKQVEKHNKKKNGHHFGRKSSEDEIYEDVYDEFEEDAELAEDEFEEDAELVEDEFEGDDELANDELAENEIVVDQDLLDDIGDESDPLDDRIEKIDPDIVDEANPEHTVTSSKEDADEKEN